MADNKYVPNGERVTKYVLMGATGLAVVFGGALLVKGTVPTITDAVALIGTLTETLTKTTITGVVAAAVVILAIDLLSPKGKLHQIINMLYSSAARAISNEIITRDPITPLLDNKRRVEVQKTFYDEKFRLFDGQMSVFRQSRDKFLTMAAESDRLGKAALSDMKKYAEGTAMYIQRSKEMRGAAYKADQSRQTAASFDDGINRLEQVRKIIVRMQELAADIIDKMDTDIEQTRARWELAQTMDGIGDAMKGILSKDELAGRATEAQYIVDTRYAGAIGALENMRDQASPLLATADLTKLAATQDLIDSWEQEAFAIAAPVVSERVVSTIPSAAGTSFANLIK
jgi:hypothetical protein